MKQLYEELLSSAPRSELLCPEHCNAHGKEIPRVVMRHNLKAFLSGAMGAKPGLTSPRKPQECFQGSQKGKSEVLPNCPNPAFCSSCSPLSAMLTFLSNFFFSVLLLSQGYFSWWDVHLLRSCPGLSA